MKHEILSWLTEKVLFSANTETLKECVELAVKQGVSLNYTNLAGANLTGADLTDANLAGANLAGANLNYANLTGANLNWTNLTDANLTGADLTDANLTGAKLICAELTCAELTDANLTNANLTCAELTCAEMIRIDGLKYPVIISPTHVHIGCKRWTIEEFEILDLSEYSVYAEALPQHGIVTAIIAARRVYQDKLEN